MYILFRDFHYVVSYSKTFKYGIFQRILGYKITAKGGSEGVIRKSIKHHQEMSIHLVKFQVSALKVTVNNYITVTA